MKTKPSSPKSPQTLDEAFSLVTSHLLEVFLKKHQDYGKGNIIAIKELGIALRETEKIERLKNLLAQNNSPANESIDDTWVDIAVYAVIALLYRKGWFQNLEVKPNP